jgi:GNAT superfamily N-acetyltransferase
LFELREALVRQIIFAMENQKIRYLVDMEKATLLQEELVPAEERPDDQIDPEGRYQDIPRWKSADGFFLMEQFVSGLHDPVLRDELQTILVSGNRVFRRFKDTLREAPEVQRRYYRYKYMAMRDVVVEWYNTLRELKGLDALELGADEELHDLLLSDISIRVPDNVPVDLILELDRSGFLEMYDQRTPPELVNYLLECRRRDLPGPADRDSTVIGAYNGMDEVVGFLWMQGRTIDGGYTLETIVQLYVLPEYRGMGIASELLDHAGRLKQQNDRTLLLWRSGPDSAAVNALVRAGNFTSLDSTFWS